MTTNNNKRVYHLTDKEGFLLRSTVNTEILDRNESSIFKGSNTGEGLLINGGKGWITSYELSNFFKDVTPIPNSQPESTTAPSQEAVTSTLSSSFDDMYHSIYEDCKAVDGSFCVYKEGIVFLWEDDEYTLDDYEDYLSLIYSIKVLRSLRK